MRSSLKKKKNNRRLPLTALSVGLLTLLAVSCSCHEDENQQEETEGLQTPVVSLLSSEGAQLTTVLVQIADSSEERQTGLMFRQSLGESEGMLFVFPADTQGSFWMRNTPISLDIIFIDVQGVIVDIIANATPLSETPLTPDQPYRHVLEVNAGIAARYGIVPGGRVELPQGVADSVS